MTTRDYWKLAGDEFWIAVDFSTWAIQSGETLVTSNNRANLSVVVTDKDGNNVTALLVEGAPVLDVTGTRVLVFIRGGVTGETYFFEIIAPTSDDERLTHIEPIEVRAA